ncbi:hypothetical protein [Streptomyces sp. NPDC048191]|uniref:SLAC1 family transporter n=1 Tax=Streptomyces sp. NPDC048191 TaxID=3155484 RepID=UPI0033E5AA0C
MTETVDTTEHTSPAPCGSRPARPAADIVPHVDDPHATRAARIRLLSVSLGTAGLGGAWQAAAPTFPPALQVSDALFTVSGLIWLVLLAQYLRHGGTRWHNLRQHLRHPGDGFTLGYVPLIGMLITGHFSRLELTWARWVYAVFLILAAFVAARLLAHWLTGTLSTTALHPGYLLPVSSAPFVASAVASTLRLPGVADAAFAVGLLYWLAFGTVILGGLVTGGPLPGPARPALTVLTIPPATGGIAWTAAHKGVFDAVGYGFAGTLLFTVLIVVLLLPELRQPSFHPGLWIFSFPVAASTNFTIRWIQASACPGAPALTGILLAGATSALGLLAMATLRHRARRPLPR